MLATPAAEGRLRCHRPAGARVGHPASGNRRIEPDHISENGHPAKVSFKHSVDSYEVSCDGHALAVWGKPIKLNARNLQDSDLTIVDLTSLKATRPFAFSKGVFSAEFKLHRVACDGK